MSDAIFLLRLEHGNYAKLLTLVDDQLVAARDGDPLDHELLESVAAYFSNFPDQCHHPKEDLIYTKLLRRDPESAAGLGQLLGEHEKLAELTQRFAATIRDEGERPSASDGKLQEVAQEFVEFYRKHILMEEEHLFSIAETHLSGNDLAEIDFDLFDRDDPMIDLTTEQRYAALRHNIDRLAEEAEEHKMIPDEANCLRGLVGVEQFNEAMNAAGWDAHLQRLAKGGYTLERDGQTVLHIPECSPRRAAWCAYFFLKGKA